MSLSSESSETLKLNNDGVIMKETTTLKSNNDVSVNVCKHSNHSSCVEERLKLPNDTSNSGLVNGAIEQSLCSEPVNGFALNNFDDNLSQQSQKQCPFDNKCDSDLKADQCESLNYDSNVSTMSPVNESDIIIECDEAKLTEQTDFSNNDNDNSNSVDVEKLIGNLEKASLRDLCIPEEKDVVDGITYVVYESEKQMPDIMRLITKDLSEPYSIYTYRYFIHNWPKLCFLAMDGDLCIGAIVCKLDLHKKMVRRGYIAMLAVDSAYRRRKLGSTLVTKAIKAMIRDDCDEVVLETEITNQAALRLYENLGFVRDKRLFRYYLNGVDALRLKLWLR